MKEKTLNSKSIYKGKIINLRIDEVVLPNGKKTTREIVEHYGAVAILPLINENNFLLVRQFRKPIEKMLMEIPAGKLEQGENIKRCAIRELREETGYETKDLQKLASVYLAPGYSSELIHIFIAKNLKKTSPEPDADEFLENIIIKKKDVLNKILNGEIKDSKTIVAIMLHMQSEFEVWKRI